MAITQGVAGSGGGGGGGAVTLAGGSVSAGAYVLGSILDGAIVTLGALGDTAVGDASGSLNAHTRQIAKLLGAGIALGAGAAVIGAVTQSGTWNVTVNTALPTGTNTIGAVTGPGAVALANDRTSAAAPFSNQLSDGSAFYVGAKTGQLPTALVGGRLDVNIGATAVTQPTAGTVAHGTANSGNPITEGRVAIAHGTNPTAVAAAARTDMYANRAGVPFMIGGHPNIQTSAQNFTAAQTDTALVTVATGLKVVVTSYLFKCHAANTVNVSARLGFGAVNTPAYAAAGLVGSDPGIAPGSGSGRGGGSGMLGVGTDDQDLRFTCSVPTGGSIDVIYSWYTIES